MLNIAICDDNTAFCEQAAKCVIKGLEGEEAQLSTFSTAEEMLSSCEEKHIYPDIAILDIEMPGIDGLELAKRLNAKAPKCEIIFLSSYLDYVKSAYYTEHIWYMQKSEIEIHMKTALNKAIAQLNASDAEEVSFELSRKKDSVRVKLREIIYIERQRNRTAVHLIDGSTEFCYTHPNELIAGSESSFIRCHQSYWLNPAMISAREADEFIMVGEVRIPISRSRKTEARQQFFDYLHK